MVGEVPKDPRVQANVEAVASGIAGLLRTAELVGSADIIFLTEMHAAAAGEMILRGIQAEMDESLISDLGGTIPSPLDEDPMETLSSANQVPRQWHAAYLTMRMVEWAVDARNPGVNPPLSQQLRAMSRRVHGDNLDRYTPQPTIFDFLPASVTRNGSQPGDEPGKRAA